MIFYHVAYLLSQFCQFAISLSRTRLKAGQPKPWSTTYATRWPTLYAYARKLIATMTMQTLAGFHSPQPQHTSPSPAKDSLLYTDLLSSVDQLLGDATVTSGGEVDAAAEFESACGSPEQPVDLTALDGISLDFPLNSYGDITYPGKASSFYRMTQQGSYLGWADFDFDVPLILLSCSGNAAFLSSALAELGSQWKNQHQSQPIQL